MRIITLILALCFASVATAQSDEWQAVQFEDGTFYIEDGKLSLWALDAALFADNRCVGDEASGPSACSPDLTAPFYELVPLKLKDVEMDYKINAEIIVEQDESGKFKPKKKPKPTGAP